MAYIDGFVIPVPTAEKQVYKDYSASFMRVIMDEYGAEEYVECWGDEVPEGENTSLPMAVKCKEDETVIFSWIIWSSKQAREEAWQKLEQDERFDPSVNPMPFDGKRMIFGGFELLLKEQKQK